MGDCECVAKGMVRKPDRQIGIGHEQAFADPLSEIQWFDFARGGSCAPSNDRARLVSRNTILLERPLHRPPCLQALSLSQYIGAVGNVHYRTGDAVI